MRSNFCLTKGVYISRLCKLEVLHCLRSHVDLGCLQFTLKLVEEITLLLCFPKTLACMKWKWNYGMEFAEWNVSMILTHKI